MAQRAFWLQTRVIAIQEDGKNPKSLKIHFTPFSGMCEVSHQLKRDWGRLIKKRWILSGHNIHETYRSEKVQLNDN